MKMLLAIIMAMASLSLMTACAKAVTLEAGQCITVPGYNTTDNSTYSQTICAEPQCRINAHLNSNGTYENTTASCDVYVTVAVPPVQLNATPCTIARNLASGETYTNTSGSCNVTVSAENRTCPSCPTNQVCTLRDTLQPNQNLTQYNRTDGACDVSLTIAQCEPCQLFDLPYGYIAFPLEEQQRCNKMIDSYAALNDRLAACSTDLNSTAGRVATMSGSFCPADPAKMLEGWNALSSYEREDLVYFSRVNDSVNYIDLSNMIAPNATGPERSNIDYFADQALKHYADIGFAKVQCTSYYNPALNRNVTSCLYSPLVNEACIESVGGLDKINGTGYATGVTHASATTIGIFAIIMICIHLYSRAPVVPKR